jgi:hypothetical protein
MTDSMIPPPPPKPDEPGVFEDLIDIFASPAKVFARRARGGGGMAFIIVSIALAAVMFSGKNIMEPIMEAQQRKGMEAARQKNPQMTQEQIDASVAMSRKLTPVFMVIGAPMVIFFLGVGVWIIGKIFGAAVTFGSSIVFASLASVPRIIGGIITDIQGLMMSDTATLVNASQISFGPARFFDPATTNSMLLALLLRFDLITIWVTVLLGIAFYAGGKLSKEKAFAAAATMWILATGSALFFARNG